MQNKIKVLHLSSEKSWRGGEQQIAYLIEELDRLGVQNVVAVRHDSVFEEHCKTRRIPFLSLPFRNTLDLVTAWKVRTFCRINKIDIVHMHSAKSHGIGVLSAILGNRASLVLSRRVDFIPKNNRITRWRYNHPSIKAIIGVSEKITSIMRAYVSNGQICQTVHSGIDPDRFASHAGENVLRKQYGLGPERVLVGNTAALEHHKDYPTFIKTIAVAAKQEPSIIGLIIGKGSLQRSLQDLVDREGLTDRIIFTGFRTDIAEVLHSLDIFLITSETEGLGTSVLDAFACRLPVVATAAGGIPEMVEHEKTGLLAPVKAYDALARNVVRIIRDKNLRSKIVEGASVKLASFSKGSTASKTLRIYKEVLR